MFQFQSENQEILQNVAQWSGYLLLALAYKLILAISGGKITTLHFEAGAGLGFQTFWSPISKYKQNSFIINQLANTSTS